MRQSGQKRLCMRPAKKKLCGSPLKKIMCQCKWRRARLIRVSNRLNTISAFSITFADPNKKIMDSEGLFLRTQIKNAAEGKQTLYFYEK